MIKQTLADKGMRKPKGKLIPIGGGEDKQNKKEILSRLVKETHKRNPSLCIITVASMEPKIVASEYRKAFRSIDHQRITFIFFTTRNEADSHKHLETIKNCDGVLLSGGNQLKFSSLLGGTQLIKLIKKRYYKEKNFVVAGTSAGAAAMSDTMIIAGSGPNTMIKGELELTNGLDFINGVFIDTHFTERRRIGRILQTVTYNPGVLGVGLAEDTALIISGGEEMEVVGSGLVMVVDGSEIYYSDLTEKENGEHITVGGIRMHILGPGAKFIISERKLKGASILPAKK
jgi:cyanophycinase